MVKFIATQIEKQADISTTKGKAKYKAYFINTQIYEAYRKDVDAKLIADGYGKVIVEG